MEDYVELIKRFETSNKIVKESIKQLMMASACMDEYIEKLKNPFDLIISEDMGKELEKYTTQVTYWFYLAGKNMQVAGNYLGGNEEGEEDN